MHNCTYFWVLIGLWATPYIENCAFPLFIKWWSLRTSLKEFRFNFSLTTEMVFCYPNCSDLLWEKIVLVIEKNFLKFEAEGREFAKILRSLEQFIRTVKGQNNFWNRILFKLVSGSFSDLAIIIQLEEIIGI